MRKAYRSGQQKAAAVVQSLGRMLSILKMVGVVTVLWTIPAGQTIAAAFEAHHNHIDGMSENNNLDLDDPASVFFYVLNMSSPDIVVGPTENYAYFRFYAQGLEWQGNMRLEIENGVGKKIHFAYFVVPAPWHTEELGSYQAFEEKDGLTITANSRFDYTVSFKGISRSFLLNDITEIDMPAELQGPTETYLGQVNDESGLRYFLIFDTQVLEFAYILDEGEPMLDKLTSLSASDPGLLVGIRTGFVFILEDDPRRKRLIGVYEGNIARNNYFDGPFDQLPDAWDGSLSVRDAFSMIDPEFATEIDKYGNFLDQEGTRIVVAPYIGYWDSSDFDFIRVCLDLPSKEVTYRSCIRDALAQEYSE